ncbi:MAG TPA: DMT family transporter [Syntrophales bacterium]|nr:DMT family transporter [Syntrophales bacterium]HOX94173.1 DMT family transporter [Syntrophales bacterium]HPI57483.1 DMT family transporter [Syntrophales bacterium]HPN25660.1 DMT family transporter [Syntrophales bacterium]HQM29508.1 DMT family transporter [Syntrophales bacterium]
MIKRVPGRWRSVVALILLAIIWGYNWVVMKKSLQYMGPFDFNALRMALGGVILLFFMLASRMSLRPRQVPMTILLGLVQTAAGTGLIIWALVEAGAGKTVILVYTMPFWILIFAWPVLSEKIQGANWIPVVTAVVGLFLILEPWTLKSTVFSEVMAVVAGVCWGLSAIIIKLMQKRPDFDLVSVTAWQFVYGSVPLVIVALLVPQQPAQWTAYLMAAVFYNAVLVCALAFLLWTYIVKKLPAGVAGMGTLAVPVIGIMSSMLELGERPDTFEAWGMVLILAAIAILTLLRFRESRLNGPAAGLD